MSRNIILNIVRFITCAEDLNNVLKEYVYFINLVYNIHIHVLGCVLCWAEGWARLECFKEFKDFSGFRSFLSQN